MKAAVMAVLWLASMGAQAQCNSVGWILVSQKIISPSETICTYEKNGAKVSIMASGFCPISPC